MRPLVWEKLDKWLEDVITPVEEPTDWANSLAYSIKPNGRLWLCSDLKDLNPSIKRDHYHTPTLEEITHQLAGSTRFTKFDGTSSYLCIVLDYKSSPLNIQHTMGTVQICALTIQTCLLPGHLPTDDRPVPHLL